jgi:hypothetical protein
MITKWYHYHPLSSIIIHYYPLSLILSSIIINVIIGHHDFDGFLGGRPGTRCLWPGQQSLTSAGKGQNKTGRPTGKL